MLVKIKNLFQSKKRALITVIAISVVAILLINTAASVFFSLILFKKGGWKGFEEYSYSDALKSDSAFFEQKGERIETENADGITLRGIQIKNEHISHSYVIMCHQYGGGPETMTEYAKHFYDLGFNIVLPCLRGNEESEYGNISLGWGDGDDILCWIDNIIEKDGDARIALFGVSMGANAVTLAASKELPGNVRLVISDSCYTSAADLMKEFVKNDTPFSPLIVTGLTSAFSKAKIGESFKNADTVAKVGDIELPIMFINGENDTVVPPLVSKKLYENCEADGVEEVIIAEGTHGRNVEADASDYWSKVDAFILNNIGI